VTYTLAHDLGTTGDKASLFDHAGRLVASSYSDYVTNYPKPGWAEQSPGDWWGATVQATRDLLTRVPDAASRTDVVGFSGQMMGCLLIDDRGEPLRDAIIWADQRAVEEASEAGQRIGGEAVYRITGHRLSPSYTASKLAWLHKRDTESFVQAFKCLQCKDYIAYRLTGALATDYSDASGTNLFDLERRCWSTDLVDAFGVPLDLLPTPVPSATVIGRITRIAAQVTGLAEGIPVVIGGGAGACATAGAGVAEVGQAYNYVGSSSWIAFVAREPLYDPDQRTFTFAHLDPDLVFPTGTMQSAGGSFDWLDRLLRGDLSQSQHAELVAAAAHVPPGANGLLFLPYLQGERSPWWNPDARGVFLGLSMSHGRPDMVRAVLEGVALNLRVILDAFVRQGAPIQTMRLIGGGARSGVWRQIMADVYGLPVLRPQLVTEATSLGAAVAAGVGVGIYHDYTVVSDLVAVEEGERPNPDAQRMYEKVYPLFKEAYLANLHIIEALCSL